MEFNRLFTTVYGLITESLSAKFSRGVDILTARSGCTYIYPATTAREGLYPRLLFRTFSFVSECELFQFLKKAPDYSSVVS